jgi:hypothetical protein
MRSTAYSCCGLCRYEPYYNDSRDGKIYDEWHPRDLTLAGVDDKLAYRHYVQHYTGLLAPIVDMILGYVLCPQFSCKSVVAGGHLRGRKPTATVYVVVFVVLRRCHLVISTCHQCHHCRPRRRPLRWPLPLAGDVDRRRQRQC